jgi:hypothetical protein
VVRFGLPLVALFVALRAAASNDLAPITRDRRLLEMFGNMVLQTLLTPAGVEVAAFVVQDTAGGLHCLLWPATGDYRSHTYRGAIPGHVVALVHTHPPKADERPSPEDIATARRFGLPVYVLTRRYIYAANPVTGAIVPVIEGANWVGEAVRDRKCTCTQLPR